MNKEEWIKQLQDRMADYQEPAPEGLWEEIESALPQDGKRKARVLPLRRWAAAAAVAAVLLGGAGYYFGSGNSRMASEEPYAEETESPASTAESAVASSTMSASADEPQLTGSRSLLAKAGSLLAKAGPLGVAGSVRTADDLHVAAADEPLAGELDMAAQTKAEAAETEKAATDDAVSEKATTEKRQTTMSDMERRIAERSQASASPQQHPYTLSSSSRARRTAERRTGTGGRWSAGLLASNVLQRGMPTENNTQPVISAAKSYNMDYSSTNEQREKGRRRVSLPGYEEHTEHHMPIAYGVSVRYKLSDRWALESGLVYSRLTSDFTRRMKNNELSDHQTLYYVGLPVAVDYLLWGNKMVSAYVQAGGQVDKNVKASLESEGTKLDMEKDRLQWSAGSALGVQLNVTPALGVYVEPGLRYYFDNGSNVENIFKDKKLSFQLQVGVRLEIK